MTMHERIQLHNHMQALGIQTSSGFVACTWRRAVYVRVQYTYVYVFLLLYTSKKGPVHIFGEVFTVYSVGIGYTVASIFYGQSIGALRLGALPVPPRCEWSDFGQDHVVSPSISKTGHFLKQIIRTLKTLKSEIPDLARKHESLPLTCETTVGA